MVLFREYVTCTTLQANKYDDKLQVHYFRDFR